MDWTSGNWPWRLRSSLRTDTNLSDRCWLVRLVGMETCFSSHTWARELVAARELNTSALVGCSMISGRSEAPAVNIAPLPSSALGRVFPAIMLDWRRRSPAPKLFA